MKKKFLALFASAVLAMSFGAPGATAAEKGQWQQTSDGNWQYLETDSSGAAQKATGWREIDGKWYYFAQKDGEVEGYKQYERVSGWIKSTPMLDPDPIKDYFPCYLQEDGSLKTGWVRQPFRAAQSQYDWKYLDPYTLYYHKGWLKDNGNWYYFNTFGSRMHRGWICDNGKWYYSGEDGSLVKNGWVDTVYSGRLLIGNWTGPHYFRKDCSMATGWEKIGEDWYYFKADGSVYNGWLSSGGKWYYLKDGVMQKNTTIDGYQIGSDGVWIR